MHKWLWTDNQDTFNVMKKIKSFATYVSARFFTFFQAFCILKGQIKHSLNRKKTNREK